MAKAAEESENHWPGFVDALSTIVMVVTFLLIILAIAIFVMSLRIVSIQVKSEGDELPSGKARTASEMVINMPKTEIVIVEPQEINREEVLAKSQVVRTDDFLTLKFEGIAVELNASSQGEIELYMDEHKDLLKERNILIRSYYNPKSTKYSEDRRFAYYRLMAARNALISYGFDTSKVKAYVRETEEDDKKGIVLISSY